MKIIIFALTLVIGSWTFAFSPTDSFDKDKSEFKVLVFLSSQCPCSNSHVKHLNTLNKKYENVQFFGVSTDIIDKDNKQTIHNYYSSKNFEFPIIKDSSQTLVKRFKALKTPHTTLLKRQDSGEYKEIYEGGVSDNRFFDSSKKHYLKENLEAVVSGKKLKYTQGKSLGCYIRRL